MIILSDITRLIYIGTFGLSCAALGHSVVEEAPVKGVGRWHQNGKQAWVIAVGSMSLCVFT